MTSIGLRQLDQATADIDRAISLDPNNAVAYLGRGMAKRMTGKFQDAITDFDRSISLNPKESSAFTERGQAYMSLNQIDKAVVDFDQALVLNPGERSGARRARARLAAEGQQRGRAGGHQERARQESEQPACAARPGTGDAGVGPVRPLDRGAQSTGREVGCLRDVRAPAAGARLYRASTTPTARWRTSMPCSASSRTTPTGSCCAASSSRRSTNTTRRWMI